MQILGILNVTRDSFSDGGKYLEPEAALAHARRLIEAGADLVDVGAESSHPDSEDVSAGEQIRRLEPLVAALTREGVRVSVDTCRPQVMECMLSLGVELINDITGLADPQAVAVLAASDARIVLMHSRSGRPRADRREHGKLGGMESIKAYFRRRIQELAAQGIPGERLILDPGMGFFLGPDAAPSLEVLRHLKSLSELGLPVLVSTSRKSFIGSILQCGPDERGAGTLATEIWAWLQGVDFIRTHAVRPLADSIRLLEAIQGSP